MKKELPKILIIGPTPPPFHGVAVSIQALLSSRLIMKYFSIIHLDIADRRPMSNIGRFDLGNVLLALKHFFQFLVLFIRNRPDIVYIPISQNLLGFLRDALFLIPTILARKRLIIHLHGSYFREFYETSPAVIKKLISWILKHTSKMIVLGENLRDLFKGLMPLEKVTVIPNGLDPEPLERLREKERLHSNSLQIIYLGTLMEEKGYWEVLQAIPDVVRYFPQARFIFAGEFYRPESRLRCEEFIHSHKLEHTVSLTGVVTGDEKIQLLLNSDILVFPTTYQYEGHPFVILEAMAAGLPVITTDQGAIKETVIDGVNGFIVPKGDPKSIAEKIILLLRDENLRKRMGQASLERFLKYYTLDRWERDMVRVFEEVNEGI